MLEVEGINYFAVAAAWLVNVVVGTYWYSPAGFGKQWARLSGVNHMKIPEQEATKIIGYVALSAVFQALTLAVILNSLGVAQLTDGLMVGLVLWLGLTAATTVGVTLYQRLGWKFWWINSSYFFVVMTINSAVLTLWR